MSSREAIDTAILHLFDVANDIWKLADSLPTEDPSRDAFRVAQDLCEQRAKNLADGDVPEVSDSAQWSLSYFRDGPRETTEEEKRELKRKFLVMMTNRPKSSPLVVPSYPRKFSIEMYRELDGCFTDDELVEWGVDGLMASEFVRDDLPSEHLIATMLTEAECDVVVIKLLSSIIHLIPDRYPGRGHEDQPKENESPERFALYAWTRWRNSATQNRRRQLAIGNPEWRCLTAPRSRQAALGHLYTNVYRTQIRMVDGFGEGNGSRCTSQGYAAWDQVKNDYISAMVEILG